MWPWEHLAFAYVLYSLTANVVVRTSPSAREAIAVAVGSQFPDLVDKPLAWTVGLTESGYSVGHSLFVAPFVCLVVYAVATRRWERVPAGVGAFALAYLSHPIADMLNQLLRGRGVDLRTVLWPIASPPATSHGGFLDHFVRYFVRYVHHLLTGGLTVQLAFQFLLGLAVLTLWLFDGAPVLADAWQLLRARRHR
ncbi:MULTISPECIES: metal-dependent hydrolase [unclassified Natrinema]|uniref:metal-dependent hydrolase n=1 Tax=unclassified Natrinema TaxID=2622230 RepID=UPI00026D43A8|nr:MULTISPECIES: metal-dependent hydrolase [unclassified Natrinema]AFO58928.1 membrane-bound metal-dependent hydrolase [Natrinema sp. J7-2]